MSERFSLAELRENAWWLSHQKDEHLNAGLITAGLFGLTCALVEGAHNLGRIASAMEDRNRKDGVPPFRIG